MIEHLLRAIHITVTLLFVFSFNLTRKMELKPLILSEEMYTGGTLSQGKISFLNRITARIAIKWLKHK